MAKRSLCISPINWADQVGVTLTPSIEVQSLPATNLLQEDVNQVWGVDTLSAGNTDFSLDVDLGQDLDVGTIGLVVGWRLDRPHKKLDTPMMAATDTIRITVDNAAGTIGTGAIADSGTVNCNINPRLGYHVFHLPTPAPASQIRISIDAISRATAGFWWGARLWIGPRHDFLRGHQYGHVEKFDLNEFDEPVRVPTFPMQHVKLSEMSALSEFEQLTNIKRQFLFTYDKADPQNTSIIGKREATTGFQSSYFQNYGFNLQIRETW